MNIFDISMRIHPKMPVYKNMESKKPILQVESDFQSGSAYETKLTMNLHTGTHIDAALHIIENGATIDALDLTKVITPCKVLDYTHITHHKITREDLEQVSSSINENDFILLKTNNSFKEDFDFNFVYLDKDGAKYLKELKIKGVGIDALGIERSQPDHETHEILLQEGIIILEGLRLKAIEEGSYFLIATPLNIFEAEAAPTRAILIKSSGHRAPNFF